MKNLLYIFVCLLSFTINSYAYGQNNNDINQLASDGFEVKFISIQDPSVIVLKSKSGNLIKTSYDPRYFELLNSWEEENENRKTHRNLLIIYTSDQGIMLKDPASHIAIPLNGAFSPHPIDMIGAACRNHARTTIDYKSCKDITLKAWDNELNRVYNALGGSKNIKLRDAQRAWIKFRDRSVDFLNEVYSSRQGTIHYLYYMDDVIDLTRTQTFRLLKIVSY